MCVEQLLEAIGVSSMSHVANQAHEAKQRCAQMEAREELVMAGLQDLQRKLLSGSQTSEGAARQDDVKATPLHWAADGGHVECIRLLLNAGATPAA
eukprot:gene1841-2512_t